MSANVKYVHDIWTISCRFTNKDTSDTSWLSSLPRVASPPPPPSPHVSTPTAHRVSVTSTLAATVSSDPPPKSTSPPSNITALQHKLDTFLKENESLAAAVSRLQGFEAGRSVNWIDILSTDDPYEAAQQAEALLIAERKRVEELQLSYQKLQDDTEIALQNEHRTVSLLVSEKTHLTAELEKLESLPDSMSTLYHNNHGLISIS
jgi:hypothetical protein